MNVHIRGAQADDYVGLCQLYEQVDQLHVDHLPEIFKKSDGPAREQRQIMSLIRDPDVGLFVAEVDGKLAGFITVLLIQSGAVSIDAPRKFGVVDTIAVDTAYHRSGLGRQLMDYAEKWAQEKDATSLELTVYDFNQGALSFYADLGYAPLSHRLGKALNPSKQGSAEPDQLGGASQEEVEKIVHEWNQTTRPLPSSELVQQLVEAQTRMAPQQIALNFENHQMNYGALNAHANRLAHMLRARGLGREMIVGVYMDRSLELIVAILGVIKAGAAFLPLDPAYPEERLKFMLEDSATSLVLTQRHLINEIPGDHISKIALDLDTPYFKEALDSDPIPVNQPDDLAYVIYTSGSTGRPKGVMVTHRGIPNLAYFEIEALGLSPTSRVMQFSAFSFDAAIWEIFATLVAGGTLILARREDIFPGSPLAKTLRVQAITHITLPPTALSALNDTDFPDLQVVVSAGEACTPELIATWSQGRLFVNAYGPTETTVCATAAFYTKSDKQLTIGRPIQNMQVYILNEALQLVSPGTAGEICIAGVGLARGYFKRPDLTAEKFIPNPFSQDPQSRLYRTGDLARYTEAGEIEYLGRMDHQVKIRGFRIELGEIESVLTKHPDVELAVVTPREDQMNDRRLIAYFTSRRKPAPSPVDLRMFLQNQLPNYMVPAAYMHLDSFPVLPNGKVDRKQLPAPDTTAYDFDDGYIEPRTRTEQVLARIWANVLGLEKIGIYDNFFSLGGHSLLATQVLSRIRDALDVELPFRSLFEMPTVAGMAERVDAFRWSMQLVKETDNDLGAGREEFTL